MRVEIKANFDVDRSDGLERPVLPVDIAIARFHHGGQGFVAGGMAVAIVTFGQELREIAVVEQANAQFGFEQDAAFCIEVNGPDVAGCCAGVADIGLAFAPEDPRGVGQHHEHALRAVLQKPAA